MSLALHDDNLQHLLSLVRALRSPRGNALLLSRAASNAEQIARLAFDIVGIRQIETESGFTAAFKKALALAGKEETDTGLVITEEMAKDKAVLQTINSFLSSRVNPEVLAQYEIEDVYC